MERRVQNSTEFDNAILYGSVYAFGSEILYQFSSGSIS